MNHVDWTHRYPLYALLGTQRLEGWLSRGQETEFALGETIFREGGKGEWAYVVASGSIRISRSTVDGREVTLGRLLPGDLFGDYALVSPYQNTATCRAAERSSLWRLPLEPLRDLLRDHLHTSSMLKRWLQLHATLQCLRGRAFVGFMSGESATRWLRKMHPVQFSAGETIQAHGLGDNRLLFIESGNVNLSIEGKGKQLERRLESGDCFGERCLAEEKLVSQAVAVTDVMCQTLRHEDFAIAQVQVDSLMQSARPYRLPDTFPWIAQQSEADCGIAALAMIARCFGRTLATDKLAGLQVQESCGLSLSQLTELAAKARLKAVAVRVSVDRLPEVRLPVIAHLCSGHYVTLFERQNHQITLGDPATGLITLSEDEFLRNWSGNLLLVTKM